MHQVFQNHTVPIVVHKIVDDKNNLDVNVVDRFSEIKKNFWIFSFKFSYEYCDYICLYLVAYYYFLHCSPPKELAKTYIM